ncbi:MAG: hypothetical protein KAT48_11895 [Bacteroidales bacterium]|nr:hypothetical protein [Bacteroidales bacterium]
MKIKISVILVFFLLCKLTYSQNLNIELQNFLVQFEKSASLSIYSQNFGYFTYSEENRNRFIRYFNDPAVLVYNDIVHIDSIQEYITVSKYCGLIEKHYPKGFMVSFNDLILHKIEQKGEINIITLSLNKNMSIDDMVEDPPIRYFANSTRLTFTIIEKSIKGESVFRIYKIAKPKEAIVDQSWYKKSIPDKIKVEALFGPLEFSTSEISPKYKTLSYESSRSIALSLKSYWDLNGISTKNFKYGVSGGINYRAFNTKINLSDFSDSYKDKDIEGQNYTKLLIGFDVYEESKFSSIGVPVGFYLDYYLPNKWVNNKKNPRPSLQFELGLSINFPFNHNFSYNQDYTNSISYRGLYRFKHPVTLDSVSVLLYDLPYYGFIDTILPKQEITNELNTVYLSGYSALTFSIPINSYFEIYFGPSVIFDITSISKENNYHLSPDYGEYNSLINANPTRTIHWGGNIGIAFNLIRPNVPYHKPTRLPSGKKASKYVMKGDIKKQLNIYLNNSPAKLDYYLVDEEDNIYKNGSIGNGNNRLNFRLSGNNTLTLKIRKPYMYDIICDEIKSANDVNNDYLSLKLTDLFNENEIEQSINLATEELTPFNLIYVSLYEDDYSNISYRPKREIIVDQVKKIVRSINRLNQNYLIYISTDIQDPVLFGNYEDFNTVNSSDELYYGILNKYGSRRLSADDEITVLAASSLKLDTYLNASRRKVNMHLFYTENSLITRKDYLFSSQSDATRLISELSSIYFNDIPLNDIKKEIHYNIQTYLIEDKYFSNTEFEYFNQSKGISEEQADYYFIKDPKLQY